MGVSLLLQNNWPEQHPGSLRIKAKAWHRESDFPSITTGARRLKYPSLEKKHIPSNLNSLTLKPETNGAYSFRLKDPHEYNKSERSGSSESGDRHGSYMQILLLRIVFPTMNGSSLVLVSVLLKKLPLIKLHINQIQLLSFLNKSSLILAAMERNFCC